MAEGTYEYECMRAELLGVDPPSYEDFLKTKKDAEEVAQVEQEEVEVEGLKVVESQGEELKGVGGKLDELNNILAVTQKKINRFKVRCGSVTELIKTKIGSISSNGDGAQGTSSADESSSSSPEQQDSDAVAEAKTSEGGENPRRSDLDKALDSNVDKLDGLLDKAEQAQCSMKEQTQRMKRLMR